MAVDHSFSDAPLAAPSQSTAERATREIAADSPGDTLPPSKAHRRIQWTFDLRLLAVSIVAVAVILALGTASYFYQSARASSTILDRAEQARRNEDPAQEAKWLRQFVMLHPEDRDAYYRLALASDQAAQDADPQRKYQAIKQARQDLSTAIFVGVDGDQESELRARLIENLLSSGIEWCLEAERQILELDRPRDDAQATRWLALALRRHLEYDPKVPRRKLKPRQPNEDYWKWLSSQPVGEVLRRAVEMNPNDVNLAGIYVTLFQQRPEVFPQNANGVAISPDGSEAPLGAPVDYARSVKNVVNRLRARDDDSQAALVIYNHMMGKGEVDQASSFILAKAPAIARQLEEIQGAKPAEDDSTNALGTKRLAVWDYTVLLAAAGHLAEDSTAKSAGGDAAERASRYYRLLALSGAAQRAPKIAESAFVRLGQLSLNRGDFSKACEIWQQGLATVNRDSLVLLRSIASTKLEHGDGKAASEAVTQLKEGVERYGMRLARMNRGELSPTARGRLSRELESAEWDLLRFQAAIATREGRISDAIDLFEQASSARADVGAEARISVARQLASLYSAQGYWDLAATSLERAIGLDPTDTDLRAAAAQAWNRAGNRSQALSQWKSVERVDSLAVRLAGAQAEYDQQLKLPPDRRDGDRLRAAVVRARQAYEQQKNAGTDTSATMLADAAWKLTLLEQLVPDTGANLEAQISSDAFKQSLVELAEERPDNAALQSYAAKRLAVAGETEEATASLKRLEKILGQQSTQLAIAEAEVMQAMGEADLAFERLISQTKIDPDSIATLSRQAAEIALRRNDIVAAYRTLENAVEMVDAKFELIPLLARLTRIATDLPEAAANTSASKWKLGDGDQLSKFWEDRLTQIEGSDGTMWRYAKASRLLDEVKKKEQGGSPNRSDLLEIQGLLRDIRNRRGSWAPAIAMEGELLKLQGRNDEAIGRLTAAIDAGDTAIETRLMLAELLILQSRGNEAVTALDQVASGLPLSDPRSSQLAAFVAVNQSDYRQAVEVAREGVANNPHNFAMRLLLAEAAMFAVRKNPATTNREELLREAESSLDRATEQVNQAMVPSILRAQSRLYVMIGDEQKQERIVNRIKESNVAEKAKGLLLKDIYADRGDYENAEQQLNQLEQSFPASIDVQLAKAELARKQENTENLVNALKAAHELDPDSDKIRRDLALALALYGGGDVPWDQIEELLATQAGKGARDRYLYALVLIGKGDEDKRDAARKILEGIVAERGRDWVEAARLLAGLHRMEWQMHPESMDSEAATASLEEAKALFERLVAQPKAAVTDVYRYADLLIAESQFDAASEIERLATLKSDGSGSEDEIDETRRKLMRKVGDNVGLIHEQLRKLQNSRGAMKYVLNLRLRVNALTGDRESAGKLVENWTADAKEMGVEDLAKIYSTAGLSMTRYGLGDQAIEWFRRAYERDERMYDYYAVALVRKAEFDTAIDILVDRYHHHKDPQSATLLAEAVMAAREMEDVYDARVEAVLNEAVIRFPGSPVLLESVATVQLQRENYDAAIRLFKMVKKLSPDRIRTLNNLAIAYAETPGEASKGIDIIEKALQLGRNNPEILDTKGVVLMKAGKLDEAEQTLRQALKVMNEPRFRFHLVQTLIASERRDEAEAEWEKMDLLEMDRSALTPAERIELERLEAEFGSFDVSRSAFPASTSRLSFRSSEAFPRPAPTRTVTTGYASAA